MTWKAMSPLLFYISHIKTFRNLNSKYKITKKKGVLATNMYYILYSMVILLYVLNKTRKRKLFFLLKEFAHVSNSYILV